MTLPQQEPELHETPEAAPVAAASEHIDTSPARPRLIRDEVQGDLRIGQFVCDPGAGHFAFSVEEGRLHPTFGFLKTRDFAQGKVTNESIAKLLDLRGNPDEPVIETLFNFLRREFESALDQPLPVKTQA